MALEVCVDNVESALNGHRGGARRLELCSCLNLGGLTPSLGLFKVVKEMIPQTCPVFVMIRPNAREDFVYNELDLKVMEEDVLFFKQNGADGFVFGCLNEDKTIDEKACGKLVKAAGGLPCTFHRAFDIVKNPEKSLETISRLGFSRILTSGQEENAHAGRFLIKRLVLIAKEKNLPVEIMPGGGINENNLKDILEATAVREFHGSAREKSSDVWKTSETVVQKMVSVAQQFQ